MSDVIAPNKAAYLEAVAQGFGVLAGEGKAGVTVMEVGVGLGATGRAVAGMLKKERGDKLIVVDREGESLERFQEWAWDQVEGLNITCVRGDARDMNGVAPGSVDMVCSDTMLNMLGFDYALWFAEVWRVLKPGGRFYFRELEPGVPGGTTQRDLFFEVLLAAHRLTGGDYQMAPVETLEFALTRQGFGEIKLGRSARPDGLAYNLGQWQPLSRPDCAMREELMAYFECEGEDLPAGPALSTSFHIACVKVG